MTYSISNLKSDLSRKVANTDKISGLDNLIEEASRNVLSRIDPQSTISSTYSSSIFYDSVTGYPVPSELKAVIDVYPVVSRNGQYFTQSNNQDFSLLGNDNTLNISYRSGLKVLNLNTGLSGSTTVATMDSLTEDMTITALNNGTNVVLDSIIKSSGSNSVSFGVTSGGQGGITVTLDDEVDTSSADAIFLMLYIPTALQVSYVDSVVFTSGAEVTTVTAPFNSSTWQLGWNIVKVPTSLDAITTFSVQITNAGSNVLEGLRIDSVVADSGVAYEISYYSNALFRSALTGEFSTQVSSDDDLVNLDIESYNILLYELAYLALEELETTSGRESKYFGLLHGMGGELGLYDLYVSRYGSQRLTESTSYYDTGYSSGSRYNRNQF